MEVERDEVVHCDRRNETSRMSWVLCLYSDWLVLQLGCAENGTRPLKAQV